MILELPSDIDSLIERLIETKTPVDIEFSVDKQEFSFTTTIKDTALFFESIPVMILAWPNEMRLQPRRRANRTRVMLPDELTEMVYLRDISVFGCAILWIQEPLLEIDQMLELDLEIPILNPRNPGEIVLNAITVQVKVIRQTMFKGLPLFGCEFTPFRSVLFFLIRQYCMIRKKEETFYSKNQYYPKLVLPEIKVKSARIL